MRGLQAYWPGVWMNNDAYICKLRLRNLVLLAGTSYGGYIQPVHEAIWQSNGRFAKVNAHFNAIPED